MIRVPSKFGFFALFFSSLYFVPYFIGKKLNFTSVDFHNSIPSLIAFWWEGVFVIALSFVCISTAGCIVVSLFRIAEILYESYRDYLLKLYGQEEIKRMQDDACSG
jgi:hypothetical protein